MLFLYRKMVIEDFISLSATAAIIVCALSVSGSLRYVCSQHYTVFHEKSKVTFSLHLTYIPPLYFYQHCASSEYAPTVRAFGNTAILHT